MLMCKVAVTMPESRGWGEKKKKKDLKNSIEVKKNEMSSQVLLKQF